jgi:MerR family mercuric resistance operon transcriptional regulator
LGFSLDQVRALIRLGGPAKASCREVREIASHHLDEIRAKIADLRKLERLLAKTVARCTGTTAPECPVLDVLDVRRPPAEA